MLCRSSTTTSPPLVVGGAQCDGERGLVPMTSLARRSHRPERDAVEQLRAARRGAPPPRADGIVSRHAPRASAREGAATDGARGGAQEASAAPGAPVVSVEHEWGGGVFRPALKLLASMNFCEWSKHAQIAAAALVYLQGVAVPIWNYEEGKRPGSVNNVLATRNAEVSDLHVYVSIGSVAAYTLFIVTSATLAPRSAAR